MPLNSILFHRFSTSIAAEKHHLSAKLKRSTFHMHFIRARTYLITNQFLAALRNPNMSNIQWLHSFLHRALSFAQRRQVRHSFLAIYKHAHSLCTVFVNPITSDNQRWPPSKQLGDICGKLL